MRSRRAMMAGGCCVLLALETAHQAAKGHEAYHHGTAHSGNRQHQLIHSRNFHIMTTV
jgi:hypothetical protein